MYSVLLSKILCVHAIPTQQRAERWGGIPVASVQKSRVVHKPSSHNGRPAAVRARGAQKQDSHSWPCIKRTTPSLPASSSGRLHAIPPHHFARLAHLAHDSPNSASEIRFVTPEGRLDAARIDRAQAHCERRRWPTENRPGDRMSLPPDRTLPVDRAPPTP